MNSNPNDMPPPEMHDAFERLCGAMQELWPMVGERIEHELPELTDKLNEFVAAGGHIRCVFSWVPDLRLTFEAITPAGETREFYWLRGRAYGAVSKEALN